MIWIDLEQKLPTDTDIPGWTPWTQEQWDAWLCKSAQLRDDLAALDATGKREERNDLINANEKHWKALKPWLMKLSYGKCWFSETRDLFSHYDVEHFRPKCEALALDGTVRDGYWWLAFDYMNYRLMGNVGNRKKRTWFPLAKGSICASYGSMNEESESRYLIDPIDELDVASIAFNEEGRIVFNPRACKWDQARVEKTAILLKLNDHAPLAEERRKVWQNVSGVIGEFAVATARNNEQNPAARATLKGLLKRLKSMVAPDAELSAVARWCVLLRNDPQLTRLIG